MKKILQATILGVMLAFVAMVANASETTGTLTTGIQTGVNGVVVEEPSASPAPGIYNSAQTVTLTGGAGSLSVHYTTDGSNPSCSDNNVYAGPITINNTTTIKAVSCYPQNASSQIASFAYTISIPSSGGGGGSSSGGGVTGGSSGGASGSSGSGGTVCNSDADFNNDGKVDIFDLNILVVNWGSNNATESTGDSNCDGKVDIFDLNALTVQWTG